MRQQWEYNIAKISGGGSNGLVAGCDKLGEDGWEAWHYIDGPDGGTVFIKRLKNVAGVSDFTVSPELQKRINRG